MNAKRVIFMDIPVADMNLAVRAAKWIAERSNKDAIVAYGEDSGDELKHFHVRRNKSSITVRPC